MNTHIYFKLIGNKKDLQPFYGWYCVCDGGAKCGRVACTAQRMVALWQSLCPVHYSRCDVRNVTVPHSRYTRKGCRRERPSGSVRTALPTAHRSPWTEDHHHWRALASPSERMVKEEVEGWIKSKLIVESGDSEGGKTNGWGVGGRMKKRKVWYWFAGGMDRQ